MTTHYTLLAARHQIGIDTYVREGFPPGLEARLRLGDPNLVLLESPLRLAEYIDEHTRPRVLCELRWVQNYRDPTHWSVLVAGIRKSPHGRY